MAVRPITLLRLPGPGQHLLHLIHRRLEQCVPPNPFYAPLLLPAEKQHSYGSG